MNRSSQGNELTARVRLSAATLVVAVAAMAADGPAAIAAEAAAAPKGAPTTSSFRELKWDELMPKDWTPTRRSETET